MERGRSHHVVDVRERHGRVPMPRLRQAQRRPLRATPRLSDLSAAMTDKIEPAHMDGWEQLRELKELRAENDELRKANAGKLNEWLDEIRIPLARDLEALRAEVEYWRDACGADHFERVKKLRAENERLKKDYELAVTRNREDGKLLAKIRVENERLRAIEIRPCLAGQCGTCGTEYQIVLPDFDALAAKNERLRGEVAMLLASADADAMMMTQAGREIKS